MSEVHTDIHIDWENEEIVMQDVDETGTPLTDQPKIVLALADLQYAIELIAKMRRVHYNDFLDDSQKKCYVLATKPEDDSSDDGHNSTTEDLWLGGGGGGGWALWDSSTAFPIGKIVRYVAGGTSDGTYICVVANTNQAPSWPEPTGGATIYWRLIALGVQEINVCSGGTGATVKVNASNAF